MPLVSAVVGSVFTQDWDDGADVWQKKRLAAGEEQLTHPPACRFADQSGDSVRLRTARRGTATADMACLLPRDGPTAECIGGVWRALNLG